MAKKVWAGSTQTNASTTQGDYSAADNWVPISIRNSSYRWVASGSGTNEYYLQTSGGANPNILEPANVQYLNGSTRTNLTAGTAGSLVASSWDYADNDALGYSTIYVRLSTVGDPDTAVALNYITYTAIPQTADDVRIPASSNVSITSGLIQNSVAIGDFIVERGYNGTIGTSSGKLYIDPDRFEYAGEGAEAWIDIGSAAIGAHIHTTGANNADGRQALNLTGSAMTYVDVEDGSVGIAAQHGETASATTIRIIGDGADVVVGESVTVTTIRQLGGRSLVNCACTTLGLYGGECRTEEEGAITTVNVDGGVFIGNSRGTITTLNGTGGTADFTQSGAPRTISTLNRDHGFSISYDPNYLTITTRAAPTKPIKEIYTAV